MYTPYKQIDTEIIAESTVNCKIKAAVEWNIACQLQPCRTVS